MTNAMLCQMMEGQQINQYHLESLLGAGGFGCVFSASEVVRDQVLRQLAIKIIPSNDNQQLKELIAAVNLEHDHLIRSYSAGECKILKFEMLYLAMELAEGSLENRFKQGEFKVAETRQIVKEILLGLNYLHSQKQVHRDLKPGNILRAKNRWKLSDFGLIRRLDNTSVDNTPNPIGTIAYMPPEAFDGNISFAWDMWSVGIMLVQMSTQRLPYQFSEPTQLLRRVMNCDLQLPPLPEEFKPIILGCLESDRAKRWTAEQALSALERSSGSPPPPPTPTVVLPPPPPTVVIKGNSYDERVNISGKNPELIKMISIPQGEFLMGSPAGEIDRFDREGPQHLVRVRGFYLAQTPITQAQWRAVASLPQAGKKLDPDPSFFKGDKRPVEKVSWQDALEFCARLSRHTGKNYRLPSEAEWEYACRAGTKTPFYFGDTISTDLANYDGDYVYGNGKKGQYRKETTEVRRFGANNFGLYDMHGNVLEWCLDPWHLNYTGAPNDGSVWDENNNDNRYQNILSNIEVFTKDNRTHVLRGGSWHYAPQRCRSAYRVNGGLGYSYVGFRPAFSFQDSSPFHS